MSQTIKGRKKVNKFGTTVGLLVGFIGGILLKSKTSLDDRSMKRSTIDSIQKKYRNKTDKLFTTGHVKYDSIQRTKNYLESEAKKDIPS
ncbi:hypothetical protein MUO14_11655 [Halobacillus shinanisalinarum]|uniref:YtxH domain-containing protein n=1 Tax=Halobacillus shinanisalinarum TaxID=2932258 RepID=A0ABY4H507_9BACI|nr:hypothetical protein [Halobacillus shinanisalinarum]UOQ95513.1 hypothetical protein MUO14_11655 [Halobacillus shinanisalinarum]